MNTTRTFFTTGGLMLAATLALGLAPAAHAQEFTFTAPTGTSLTAHPGDSIAFSGTLTNDTQLEQIDSITIGMMPTSNGGVFTFASPFFADLAIGESRNFSGTLKVSSSAPTSTTKSYFFYLDANGTGDSSGYNYDLTSNNFSLKVVPAVPEASTTVSFGVLLALGLGAVAFRARKRSVRDAQ